MKKSKGFLFTLALVLAIASVYSVMAKGNNARAIDVYYDPPGATTCAILFSSHPNFANSGTTAATIKSSSGTDVPLYATNACSALARAYFIP